MNEEQKRLLESAFMAGLYLGQLGQDRSKAKEKYNFTDFEEWYKMYILQE